MRKLVSHLQWRAALTTLVLLIAGASAALLRIPAPAASPPALPSSPPEPEPQEVDWLLPFVETALQRRAARAAADPEFDRRVDPVLNHSRINLLVFGYGETYEPPFEKDTIGSITILSINRRTNRIAHISLTHDARAPEIERYWQRRGTRTNPSKIDQAYQIGGFDLMRLAVENATGLSIDFQIAFEDVIVKNMVDDVMGGVEVDSPFELATIPFYVQGTKYPGRQFPKGRQRFDGLGTMCYLKAIQAGRYDPAKENNLRKHVVFSALQEKLKESLKDPLFPVKALAWLHGELERKGIAYDFEARVLVVNGVKTLAAGQARGRVQLPQMGEYLYLADAKSGDGGFEWVAGSLNPIIRGELRKGIYVDRAMVVPRWGADPYAENLASGYWASVRSIVYRRLHEGNE